MISSMVYKNSWESTQKRKYKHMQYLSFYAENNPSKFNIPLKSINNWINPKTKAKKKTTDANTDRIKGKIAKQNEYNKCYVKFAI